MDNPYQVLSSDVVEVSEDEELRRLHLSHESSIRSFGFLAYLAGSSMLFLALAAGAVQLGWFTGEFERQHPVFAPLLLLGSVYAFWLGGRVRTLRLRRRWQALPMALLWLAALGLGTILGVYFLSLIYGAKGRFILSDEYLELRRRTPHIRYRTSKLVWIFLLLLLSASAYLLYRVSRSG